MKRNYLEKLSPICWITFMGLITVASVLSGCGRHASFAQPKVEASPALQEVFPDPSPSPVMADLKEVRVSASDVGIADAAVLAYGLISNNLVIRSETYTNPNSTPVWIWVYPSISGLHFWGVCTFGRAQYHADPSWVALRLNGAKEVSKGLPMGSWGAFELAGGESAKLEWVTGGKWSWNSGPYSAPGESCDESRPQRGWAGFEVDGSVSEDLRFSQPETPYADATGERNFLDSSRVLAQPLLNQSLGQHWGDYP